MSQDVIRKLRVLLETAKCSSCRQEKQVCYDSAMHYINYYHLQVDGVIAEILEEFSQVLKS